MATSGVCDTPLQIGTYHIDIILYFLDTDRLSVYDICIMIFCKKTPVGAYRIRPQW